MRTLTDHMVNPANERLKIEVQDAPGAGGANHRYCIDGADFARNPSGENSIFVGGLCLLFQNGPIKESGVNGITHEALLAILIDRLRGFQAGQYACRENAVALTKLEEALMWLNKRTAERERRGVEGTHAK